MLRQVGCEFRVVPSEFSEDNSQGLPPELLALAHARSKALEVSAQLPKSDIVIGADTVVALNGQIFGKPDDAADAVRMLSLLAGHRHVVYTGVAVVRDEKIWTAVAATEVFLRELTVEEICRYVATGEPHGKAGAYAIQGLGALLVERIEGCYTNVVGLPLVTLERLLTKAGVCFL